MLLKLRRTAPLFRQMGKAFARTIRRRAVHGPKRPSWSLRYEAFVEMLRIQFGEEAPTDLVVMRRNFDRTGDQEDRRGRSRTTWGQLGGVRAAWVEPARGATDGVVLYLHGGGYVVGSPQSHRGIMASIAIHARTRVVGIDYRLAPEAPCPAGIEDAVAAYEELLRDHGPETMMIMGDSAGGGLTAATLVALRDRGLPLPAGAVLISPWVDLREQSNDWVDQGFDFIVENEGEDWAAAYASELGRDDHRVSPVLADISGLPPLLVIAGEVEVLVDQSRAFAARAREAGVDCTLHVEPDEVHVYPAFFDLSPRAQAALGRIGGFARRCLDAPRANAKRTSQDASLSP